MTLNKLEKITSPNFNLEKINPKDYILFQKGNGKFAISIKLFYQKEKIENQHILAIKENKLVSDINESTIMLREVINSQRNGILLYHPDGSVVEKSILDNLYNQLLTNNQQNLNSYCEKNNKDYFLKNVIGFDSEGELVYSRRAKINTKLQDGNLIDLEDFDENGLPTKKSNNLFDKNKNIYGFFPDESGFIMIESTKNESYFKYNKLIENYAGVRLVISIE